MENLIRDLYDSTKFNIREPELIISVTGGAKKFSLESKLKSAFKEGLISVAKSTNSTLVTTGGTNCGVMKLVGEAIAESEFKYTTSSIISVLGIALWNKLYDKEELQV